jgi:hypothetical protein
MAETKVDLAVLRFNGTRFEGHALDVDCTQELIAYRALVLECAKELWRQRNPLRARLPKGFEDGFRVQFDRIEDGSAAVPLTRLREVDPNQPSFEFFDEFDEAARLIDATIAAADRDALLPERLPVNIVPLFGDLGRTLREDEVLYTRARGTDVEAPFTSRARARLAGWIEPTYEDLVELLGEVRMANVGPGAFRLLLSDGVAVEGKFEADQEALVLDALRDHATVRLHLRGTGEFSTRDRKLRKLLAVSDVSLAPIEAAVFDESAPAIWEQLAAIGRGARPGAWQSVPDDLSSRIDEIIYRREREPKE